MSEALWKVYVVPPRKGAEEKHLHLRAKRRRPDGKFDEQRLSTKTLDPSRAEQLRIVWESDLNFGGQLADLEDPTLLTILDARLASLRTDPDASPNTIGNYEAARKAFATTSLANVVASQLTKRHLVLVQGELRSKSDGDKPRMASTAKHYMDLAQAAWRWAMDLELVRVDWPRLARNRKIRAQQTNKRPYTDDEVVRILAWVSNYEGGRWLPVFQLLADTSARIGMVLGLHGKDIRRGSEPAVSFRVQWVRPGPNGKWRNLKTKERQLVPLPPSTAALLPMAEPNELLFPNAHDKRRPARPETVRDILYRALDAIGVPDPENLDTHSLRRAWVDCALNREGIPATVAMRITGHKDLKVLQGYQRNGIGIDMVGAVGAVHERRKRAGEALGLGTSPATSPASAAEPLSPNELPSNYDLTS